MLINYRVAWRTIKRNKVFSLINIIGLAAGLACSLFILLWVQDERSMDGLLASADRRYVVYQLEHSAGETGGSYYTSGLLADELKRVIPGVRYAAGYANNERLFQVGSNNLRMEGAFAGSDFFRIFPFPLLLGDAADALSGPTAIAISRKMAVACYGSPEAAMGKTLRSDGLPALSVTAVFDNFPEKSSLQFDYIINWELFRRINAGGMKWDGAVCQSALLLKDNVDAAIVGATIRRFLDTYYTNQGPGLRVELGLQRYDEKYLNGNFRNGHFAGGRMEYVRLFSVVAVFILLIACINFMNLTTARAAKRAKEIGVRKVIGAGRGALISQFMLEALLMALLAMVLALGIVYLLLPLFNKLTAKHILLAFASPAFWGRLIALTCLTGLVAGSYPALFLSALQPVKVLKGVFRSGKGVAGFRKGLVVFQFSLSILLIIGAIIVSRQVRYIQKKNLGYNRENLVRIPVEGELARNYKVFRQMAAADPAIKSVTIMTGSQVAIGNYQDAVQWEGMETGARPTFAVVNTGYDFGPTMGVTVLQGRDFSTAFPTDTNGFVINESAALKMGFKAPLGKWVTLEDGRHGPIIGMVKDFHLKSLHDALDPLIIAYGEKGWGSILVKLQTGKTSEGMHTLERLCRQLNPKYPFSYIFADEDYQRLYQHEKIVEKLSDCFAVMAVFISCIGLLGLSLFSAEQRAKEIGIRKVLGASAAQLFALLAKESVALVLLAMAIAAPLASWLMGIWLQNYAYRISISWWIYLLAGGLTLLAALLTIGYQAGKAVLTNPAKSLRAE